MPRWSMASLSLQNEVLELRIDKLANENRRTQAKVDAIDRIKFSRAEVVAETAKEEEGSEDEAQEHPMSQRSVRHSDAHKKPSSRGSARSDKSDKKPDRVWLTVQVLSVAAAPVQGRWGGRGGRRLKNEELSDVSGIV